MYVFVCHLYRRPFKLALGSIIVLQLVTMILRMSDALLGRKKSDS